MHRLAGLQLMSGVFVVMIAGCGSGSSGGYGSNSNTGASSPPPSAAANAVQIQTATASVAGKSETVLADSAGLTLYYRTSDTPHQVSCSGGCASVWPPLLAPSGAPTGPATLTGTLSVLDGANGKQVLYNGHPLYRYSKDVTAGDAHGQGLAGVWFVATPDLALATG